MRYGKSILEIINTSQAHLTAEQVFLELKKTAIKKWRDSFTQERFHKAVLDTGPAPFEIVEKYALGE